MALCSGTLGGGLQLMQQPGNLLKDTANDCSHCGSFSAEGGFVKRINVGAVLLLFAFHKLSTFLKIVLTEIRERLLNAFFSLQIFI